MTETILRKDYIMKRTLSIILCLVMVLSLAAVSAYAAPKADEIGKVASGYTPEGTGITSLAEATDPAGKYYLTKDITVSATVEVAFTGTIDGNGKTITVSAPVFTDFSGTLKNAVIAGAVDTTGEAKTTHTGTVGRTSVSGATFENVKNTATVKGWVLDDKNMEKGDISSRIGTGGFIGHATGALTFKDCANTAAVNGYAVGGFVGYAVGAEATLYFENCLNSGKITDEGAVKVGNNGSLGGIVGISDNGVSFTFKNVHNTGDVLGTNGKDVGKSQCPAGGIIGYGYIGKGKFETSAVFENVSNTGKVTGTNQVGGIGGYMCQITTCTNVVNKGDVESFVNYAGGLFSRIGQDQPDTANTTLVIATLKNCENYGNVKSGQQYGGGMIGYCPYGATAENCVNYGDIDSTVATSNGNVGGIYGTIWYNTVAKNCFNYGDLATSESHNNSAGGIAGRAGHKGGVHVIENCGNYGNIVAGSKGGSVGAGGILGYIWGGSNGSSSIYNCFNVGKLTVKQAAGCVAGIVPYFNCGTLFNIQGCYNAGEIVVPEGHTGVNYQLWYNNNATMNLEGIKGNFYLAGDGKNAYGYKGTDGAINVAGDTFTAEELKNGALAYKLNEAIGKEVYKQTLGTDATPAFEGKSVIKNADGTYANPAPVTPSKPTGDMTVVIFAIMVLTVGSAVVIGKKISVR